MGFSTGAEIADKLWEEIEDYIPPICREEVATAFVEVFEQYDCDTMEDTEVYNIAFAPMPTLYIPCCPRCGSLDLDLCFEEFDEMGMKCRECGQLFTDDEAGDMPCYIACPSCGELNTNIVDIGEEGQQIMECLDCGHEWEDECPEIIVADDLK